MGPETPRLRRRQPETVPGDLILPLGSEDDNWVLRSTLVGALFKFDDVLDAERLQLALARLLEHKDWRKLGARLRKDMRDRLEYHIPSRYSNSRPGFQWHHDNYDMSVAEHAEATSIPTASNGPVLFSQSRNLAGLTYAPDAPTRMEDFLYSDKAQLSVRVTTFRDGTTVGLSFLHTLMDMMSLSDVMRAWMSVLKGGEEELVPLHGFDKDPLADLGSHSEAQQWLLLPFVLTGVKALMFVTKLLQKAMFGEDVQSKLLRLPREYVEDLRQHVALEKSSTERRPDKVASLGSGDVVAAWLTRLALQQMEYLSPTSLKQRDVVIVSDYSLRELRAEDLLPPDKAYLGNSMSALYTIEPIGEVMERSMSWLVSRFRASVASQGMRSQQELAYKTHRLHQRQGGRPALIGTAQGMVFNWCNWQKADLFSVDMSSAVVPNGGANGSAACGRPSFINVDFQKHARLFSARNSISILGEDGAGNMWVSGVFERPVWEGIQRMLDRSLYASLYS